ncbi:MAG TPA: AMP-binding protein [Chthoniobacterales bacterium]|nr:AMP-binding protein [Chthoniobacterales bacterium]
MSGTDRFRAARDFLLANRSNCDVAYRDFQWPKLDQFNWALDWFDSIGSGRRCNQTAIWVVFEDGAETKLSFRQLSNRSSQIANYFRELGIGRGDRVMVMLGNVAPLWETVLALIKLGAVILPATTLLSVADVADRIERGRVRHIVCGTDSISKFENLGKRCTRIVVGGSVPTWHAYEDGYNASAEFEPEGETGTGDPMQLYFTSGTTSKPKLVMHSQETYPVGHLSTMYWIGLQPGDIHCNISSPGWAKHAWSCVFAPWNAEATVFVPNQSRFNAKGVLESITAAKVTSFCAPPTVWRILVTHRLSDYKTNLREVVSAGEPLNPEIIDHVRSVWGLTVRDGYGQTETSAVAGNPPGQLVKPGSVARALPGFQLALLDNNDRETNEGEVCIKLNPRPLGLMPGYQAADGGIAPLEGEFYRTGDVMSRDAEGYLTFVGRCDDIFKSSDYRISPFELESALIEHPDVVECAVVPSPDPIRSAVPKAFIILQTGVEPSRKTALSIFQHIRNVLAPFNRVRRIEFSDLPKTISGKIRRVELREREVANAESGTRPELEFREEDFAELR